MGNSINLKVLVAVLIIVIFIFLIPVVAFTPGAEIRGKQMIQSQNHKIKYKEGEIIVKFKSGRNVLNLGQIRVKYNLKDKKKLDKTTTKLLSVNPNSSLEDVIKDLKASGQVEYAEPNYARKFSEVTDPYYNLQWGMENIGQIILGLLGISRIDIGVKFAWSQTKGSTNVVVGVIDTGIDINHPDLINQIWTNPGEIANDGIDNDNNGYIDDVNGWDFVHDDKTVFDKVDGDEHATHVSGIIAASHNTIGVAGVAPNVRIMPLKILTPDGGYVSDEVEAIAYAKAMGVKIINMSLGGYGFSKAEYDALQNINALIVAAAGNEGVNNDGSNPCYPASYDLNNIISVAAMNNIGTKPLWSNYGATTVDIAAPGVSVLSTVPGNQYAYYDGTSMATPFVTGTSALLLSKNPTADAISLKQGILANSTPISSLKSLLKSGGMLSAGRALYEDTFCKVPQVDAITDRSTIVSGLADPVATVIIRKGTQIIGQGVTTPEGTSEEAGLFSIPIPLQKGGTELTVTAMDQAGNLSQENRVVVIDLTPPVAPVVNKVTNQNRTVTGQAEAGSTVVVKVGTQTIGQGTATSSGTYSISIPLQKGGTEITVLSIDKAGNSSTGVTIKVKISFVDIQNVTWSIDAIETMAELGIINGVGNNKYGPTNNVTRAQFAKLIITTLGITGTAQNPFIDVKSTDWFAHDVALAFQNGIVNGVSQNQFAPNRFISRQEMATMMVRAIKYKQQVTSPNVNETLGKFTDQNQIDTWAKEGVAICNEQGLILGMTETIFYPKTNATRAQSAVIMYRFYNNFVNP